MEPDWSELGLRVGLEVHQQLDTRKLFCDCPSELDEGEHREFTRRLRPTRSELGDVDRAAAEESMRSTVFGYQAPVRTSCLVEADEEPPHAPNAAALDVSLVMAELLGSTVVDELHFMRKVVIDGSNTTGFQRTALLGMGGALELPGGRVKISTICLEEDAARPVTRADGKLTYRLDRLGIPLIEIATEPDIATPGHAREAAERIGALLRATGRAKRGIGTIREDINVSIKGGARVEIKGIQELKLIPVIIESEVHRQLRLIGIAERLRERGVEGIDAQARDITDLFEGTECKVISSALNMGGAVLGARLPGFAGLLGRDEAGNSLLGAELAGYARKAGVRGLFHGDELPGYGITSEEVGAAREALSLGEDDSFVIVAGAEDIARRALGLALGRAGLAIGGVPEETRDANDDGSTAYSRPLPGSARMYPETDVPPVPITEEMLGGARGKLPELPEEKVARFEAMGLHRQLAEQLVADGNADHFEAITRETGLEFGTTVASTIAYTFKELDRDGVRIDPSGDGTTATFKALAEGGIAKEAWPGVFRAQGEHGVHGRDAIEAAGVSSVSDAELEGIIERIVQERVELVNEKGLASAGQLMGIAMRELRGKADGKRINEVLTREIKRVIG